MDYEWQDVDPVAPNGLFIGLPDQANDRWIWLPAADARGAWLAVASLNLAGVDPVTHPNGSYIAVVNFSNTIVNINRLALRVDPAGATNVTRDLLPTGPVTASVWSARNERGPRRWCIGSATHSCLTMLCTTKEIGVDYARGMPSAGQSLVSALTDAPGFIPVAHEKVFPAVGYASDRGYSAHQCRGSLLGAFTGKLSFAFKRPLHTIARCVEHTFDTNVVPYSVASCW